MRVYTTLDRYQLADGRIVVLVRSPVKFIDGRVLFGIATVDGEEVKVIGVERHTKGSPTEIGELIGMLIEKDKK